MRKLTLMALTTVLAACAEPAETPPTGSAPATPAVAAPTAAVHEAVTLTAEQQQGKVTFESVCWTCHGSGGHGDGPASTPSVKPPTFHTPDYAAASQAILLQRFQASMQGADASHPHMQYVVKLVREESFKATLAYIPALVYPSEIPGSAVHGLSLIHI